MKYITEKTAWNLRTWIYVAAILSAALSFFLAFSKVIASEPIYTIEAFWPPDMVPHPTVPGDGPKDDSKGDLA